MLKETQSIVIGSIIVVFITALLNLLLNIQIIPSILIGLILGIIAWSLFSYLFNPNLSQKPFFSLSLFNLIVT